LYDICHDQYEEWDPVLGTRPIDVPDGQIQSQHYAFILICLCKEHATINFNHMRTS